MTFSSKLFDYAFYFDVDGVQVNCAIVDFPDVEESYSQGVSRFGRAQDIACVSRIYTWTLRASQEGFHKIETIASGWIRKIRSDDQWIDFTFTVDQLSNPFVCGLIKKEGE